MLSLPVFLRHAAVGLLAIAWTLFIEIAVVSQHGHRLPDKRRPLHRSVKEHVATVVDRIEKHGFCCCCRLRVHDNAGMLYACSLQRPEQRIAAFYVVGSHTHDVLAVLAPEIRRKQVVERPRFAFREEIVE